MRFTIRDSRPADFPTLWKIDQSCFPPGISYTPWELKTYMCRWGAFTLVAESDTEPDSEPGREETARTEQVGVGILGFLVAERSRRGPGHIITIDVVSLARRQRVGSELLDAAEERLRTLGCSWVQLETAVDNGAALFFYKQHGYSVIKTVPRYYASGVDALVLEKKLRLSVASR